MDHSEIPQLARTVKMDHSLARPGPRIWTAQVLCFRLGNLEAVFCHLVSSEWTFWCSYPREK